MFTGGETVKRSLSIMCFVMAILIVIISMTTVSFSWFEPDVKEGIGLEFKDEVPLRTNTCSISTYEGSAGNKIVTYNTEPISSDSVNITATKSTTTSSDGTTVDKYTPVIKYYKTVITNTSKDYDTVVSLFLPSFYPSSDSTDINPSSSIGVAVPTNSYRTFNSQINDIHIIRNANVSKLIETDANPGQLIVEWFVKCDKGSVTFNPSDVYLTYN